MMNRQQALIGFLGPGVSQQAAQFRQQMPQSRPMMSNINPSVNRVTPSNPRMAATPGSNSSWGYPQQDSSRPSSTNPYTSASLQAFDRPGTNPWQTTSLDPSDFPALGSGSSIQSHGPPQTAQSYASTAGTGALHQQRLQTQQTQQQQLGNYPRQSDAPFSSDEFPALGGLSDNHAQRQGAGLPQHLAGQANGVYDPRQQGSAQMMTPPPNAQALQQQQDHRASMLEALQGQRGPPRTAVTPNALASPSVKDIRLSDPQGFQDDQKLMDPVITNPRGLSNEEINAAAEAAQTMSNQDFTSQDLETPIQDSEADMWGIKGLLGIIKIEDSDKSKLALGVDLTTLGLNMNQPDVRPLFPNFHSPWQDISSRHQTYPDFDPKYDLPACYRMGPPPSALSKMSKFSDETLFYIFYAMPQDLLQDAAAFELTRRNWRYHKGIQLWLTKPQDATVTRTNESFEQGEFIFWDVNMWQKTKQKFFLSYDMLEIRDTSLPYEELNPEAVKLERRSSVESRKVPGRQIGSGSGAES